MPHVWHAISVGTFCVDRFRFKARFEAESGPGCSVGAEIVAEVDGSVSTGALMAGLRCLGRLGFAISVDVEGFINFITQPLFAL